MAIAAYLLCTLTSLACAWLLLRTYSRTRVRLLFWSGLCFAGLALSNALSIVDRFVLPDVDLVPARLVTAFVALLLMVLGLVWEGE
jgi:hypothetical protein